MTEVYPASTIKPATRQRASQREVEARREGLIAIVAAQWPMTVRQIFYQATVSDLVEKSEAGYARVQTDLVWLRRNGLIPYEWIVDNTRWEQRPRTYKSIAEALTHAARSYRRSLWSEASCHVEVWLEKDALAGVIVPVTAELDVSLRVARGYASLSFLHEAGTAIAELGVPCFIYHLGDFDPSGVDAGRNIEKSLKEYSGGAAIHFERLAVNPEQIEGWSLPSRPTKATDSRSKTFGYAESVELDAIPPDELRNLVREAIERHITSEELARLNELERDEQAMLLQMVGEMTQ
jgi:hypothetical protein